MQAGPKHKPGEAMSHPLLLLELCFPPAGHKPVSITAPRLSDTLQGSISYVLYSSIFLQIGKKGRV